MAKVLKPPLSPRAQRAAGKAQKRLAGDFPAFAQASTSQRRGAAGIVLKLLRSLPARSKLQPHELDNLIKGVVDVLKAEGITPAHLGGKSARQVALLLIELREVIGYSSYSLKRLKGSRGGLAYYFKGKLFELFVHNHPELRADFEKMGRLMCKLFLNDTVARRAKPKLGTPTPKALINAKGRPQEVTEKFGAPVKVTKIWISDGKNSREFVDIPYVSLSPKPAGTFKPKESPFFVSPVVSVEIKTRAVESEGALKGAGPQVSDHLARWRDAKTVGMEIDGASYSFKPEDILFNPAAHTPVVVTTARTAFAEYEFRESRVGTRETFLVVGIPVNTQALNKLVRVLFP